MPAFSPLFFFVSGREVYFWKSEVDWNTESRLNIQALMIYSRISSRARRISEVGRLLLKKEELLQDDQEFGGANILKDGQHPRAVALEPPLDMVALTLSKFPLRNPLVNNQATFRELPLRLHGWLSFFPFALR